VFASGMAIAGPIYLNGINRQDSSATNIFQRLNNYLIACMVIQLAARSHLNMHQKDAGQFQLRKLHFSEEASQNDAMSAGCWKKIVLTQM
jgi:hypothetical protein